ncbi:50S ribosomal protein L3 N(5)-glutamine methyltransferase [Halioxenophilus aromaticivorans]|uniref:Ribosomal protein uL3 glutamine methyltransferase n=1 Tax=Halioxenophilus aromaticivorans TaxID=1306992 RepID=A0AAV3TWQ6_9ALTE
MAVDEWLRDTTPLATIRDYVRFGATKMSGAGVYFGHGTDNAWDEACFLVLEALDIPWSLIDQVLDAKLTVTEREQLVSLFEIRIRERIPAAYLLGKTWFAGWPFIVNENVLIPRSPIGELIEKDFTPWLTQPPQRVLDMCTGSGCIGIATALRFPDAIVDLSDISPEAVDVAWQNIDYHGLEGRVQAIESDMFAALEGQVYDLIICNPPYVDAEDLSTMPKEYQYEPKQALGSGDDGLNFTRKLLAQAKDYLSDDGVLVCEVGNSWFALEAAFSDIAFTWVDFERGGHGVFVMTAAELVVIEDLEES